MEYAMNDKAQIILAFGISVFLAMVGAALIIYISYKGENGGKDKEE